MFLNLFYGKKVLITGNTGFKGSWLSAWLIELGAEVIGVSKDIPTSPSLFEILNLKNSTKNYTLDINEKEKFIKILIYEKPDYVFHLAAQAIVSKSFKDSYETILSNVLGTGSLLESLKCVDWPLNCVMITSDKSYLNLEWHWGYKETDTLGGKDIYSGSKAAAEQLIFSYYESFFKNSDSSVKIAVGRAGNVIGGGDWAKDRVVVDTVKAWSKKEKVNLRSPYATRPWQHVLEPLSGYLHLASSLNSQNDSINGEAFNFGPNNQKEVPVVELIKDLSTPWFDKPEDSFIIDKEFRDFSEARLLKLNCDKALSLLKWHSTLSYKQTHEFVSSWYYKYYHNIENISNFTIKQIRDYQKIATENELKWTMV